MSQFPALTTSQHRLLLRADFAIFAEAAFRIMNRNEAFLDLSHNRLICAQLSECFHGRQQYLCINLPPRSLKSFIASVAFPAWVLGNKPDAKFLCVSYGADLAEKFARDCHRLMTLPWYQEIFSVRLTRHQKSDFETSEGGYRLSVGMDGASTGRGADYLIIDDPTKPEDVLSDKIREEVNSIFATKLYTRLNEPQQGRIILVQQRQHVEDLSGFVTARRPWKVLSFPAIGLEDEDVTFATALGMDHHYREEGRNLDPRMPLSWLRDTEQLIGTYAFSAQYQQQPVPLSGNLIKTDWLHFYGLRDLPPVFDYFLQSVDSASTVGQSSAYSVFLTFGIKGRQIFLLDELRERIDYPTLRARLQTHYHHCLGMPKYVLIEEKASGIQLIQEGRRMGIPVQGVIPKLAKDIRLQTVSHLIQNGTLLLPNHKPWSQQFVHELTTFPQSKYSDRVDALSQALEWLNGKLFGPKFEADFGWGPY